MSGMLITCSCSGTDSSGRGSVLSVNNSAQTIVT